MKLGKISAAALAACALAASAGAQPVRTEYRKDVKMTAIETGMLYLLNTPEQFVEAQITTAYKGETMAKPPDKVSITLFSFSKKPQYRHGAQLSAVLDGERLKLGTTRDPTPMIGETKGGAEIFFREGSYVGMQVPVPKSAKIRGEKGINGVVMELMIFEIKPEVFAKIAGAKQVELHLGDTPFTLTEGHLNILRDFAGRLKPQA